MLTYVCNIGFVGYHPSHLDSCTQGDVVLCDIRLQIHKDLLPHKDLDNAHWYKTCLRNTRDQLYILAWVELQQKYKYILYCNFISWNIKYTIIINPSALTSVLHMHSWDFICLWHTQSYVILAFQISNVNTNNDILFWLSQVCVQRILVAELTAGSEYIYFLGILLLYA